MPTNFGGIWRNATTLTQIIKRLKVGRHPPTSNKHTLGTPNYSRGKERTPHGG